MQILKFNNDKILLNLFDKKIVLTTIILKIIYLNPLKPPTKKPKKNEKFNINCITINELKNIFAYY